MIPKSLTQVLDSTGVLVQSEEWEIVQLLHLDVPRTAMALQRIIETSPVLYSNLAALGITAWLPGEVEPVGTSDVTLVSNRESLPVRIAIDVFDQALTLTWKSNTTLQITVDDINYIVPVTYVSSNNRLHVAWPEELGIAGDLQLGLAVVWDSDFEAKLPIRTGYPVARVVQQLLRSNAAYHVLQRANLDGAFYSLYTDAERLGVMVVSILKNLRHE